MKLRWKISVSLLILGVLFITNILSYNTGYQDGALNTVLQVQKACAIIGCEISIIGDAGNYQILFHLGDLIKRFNYIIDFTALMCRPSWSQGSTSGLIQGLCPSGYLELSYNHHAATLTNDGKNQIACFISSGSGCTAFAVDLGVGCSTITTCTAGATLTFNAADHFLGGASTNECTDASCGSGSASSTGLANVAGTYTLTGTGTWTVVHTFTAGAGCGTTTAVCFPAAAGLYWSTSVTSGVLMAEDNLSPTRSMVSGDTLALTDSNSVS